MNIIHTLVRVVWIATRFFTFPSYPSPVLLVEQKKKIDDAETQSNENRFSSTLTSHFIS